MWSVVWGFLKGIWTRLTSGTTTVQAGKENQSISGVSVADNTGVVVVAQDFTLNQVPSLHTQRSNDRFTILEQQIPELLEEMRQDLTGNSFCREFIILSKKWTYCADRNKTLFYYYFEEHSDLRNKLQILENYELIREITYNKVERFVITEELAAYLLATAQT